MRAAFASPTGAPFVVSDGHRRRPRAGAPRRGPGQTVYLDIGAPIATGVHLVDSPAVDADGVIYATCSGSRGQQSSVSVYRIGADGVRDVFVTGLTNATSMAFDPQGRLHVSSRFDGTVSRIDAEGRAETVATELGVATGLAFDPEGVLYVGDRSVPSSGCRTAATPRRSRRCRPASPPTTWRGTPPTARSTSPGPTISTRDRVYRIGRQGDIRTVYEGFGRPQGLAVDTDGSLLVAEALAGASGIYRVRPAAAKPSRAEPELVVSGPALVGVAVHPAGGYVVATADAVYRCY